MGRNNHPVGNSLRTSWLNSHIESEVRKVPKGGQEAFHAVLPDRLSAIAALYDKSANQIRSMCRIPQRRIARRNKLPTAQ